MYFTESSSGSVRVQVPVSSSGISSSGESGDDVVKSRSGNENGHEITAVGRHYLFCHISVHYIYFFVVTFAFSALTLLVWQQEGHPACKKLTGGMWAWLSWMRCRLAYSPADATATHYLLLQ